ncbi:MAG: ATP-binding protein [Betaproteobacteria bacterium]
MSIQQLWHRSTLVRLSLVLGAIAALAIGVVLAAAVVTEQSTGRGVAINVAGSLRMQSYHLAVRAADARADVAAHAAELAREVADFERRLNHPQLQAAARAQPQSAGALDGITAQWTSELRPLALAAGADAAARAALLDRVDGFVARIDAFVRMLEADLESRIHWLQVAQGATVLAIVVLALAAFFLLDVLVFQPIRQLVESTQSVRRGRFDVRAARTGPDEIGQLGADFNHMVEELGRLYGSLERQVADKTADLERKNRSLALLYDTTKALTEKPLAPATLRAVLDSVKAVLGVEGGVICAHSAGCKRGLPLVRDATLADEIFDGHDCAGCGDGREIGWRLHRGARGERRIVDIPLVDAGVGYGVMPLLLAPGQRLEPWQIELAQTVGRHVGAALAGAARREEHPRLALHEERSAIARELHDSIAQSLSYTKIQLARLAALLSPAQAPQAQAVLGELRTGVADAYRQLRELLTTFRLQAGGAGLVATLRQDAEDFTRRSGVAATVEEELSGAQLSANEQVHLQQIVREALANIEKHAQARRASVRLARGEGRQIELVVEDDGVGIAAADSPRHHFGLSIMRDRARLLGGDLQIGPRVGGGTRVALHFEAAKTFGAGQGVAADVGE